MSIHSVADFYKASVFAPPKQGAPLSSFTVSYSFASVHPFYDNYETNSLESRWHVQKSFQEK